MAEDIFDETELTIIAKFFGLLDERRVVPAIDDQDMQIPRIGHIDEPLCFAGIGGHRLFNQYMQTPFEGGVGMFEVCGVR